MSTGGLVPSAFSLAFLHFTVQRASRSFLFRDSDFAMLVFRGAHRADGALPVHLRPENYPMIRERLPRLRIVEGGLADLGERDVGAFDGFSLSDFGSYCGTEPYASCWKGVLAVAAPGARLNDTITEGTWPI